jgi:hypothetical protein
MAIPSKNIRAERITGSLDASGINMSGSFTSITATSFTGSLFGTASFASTASFVNPLTQSVSIRGTGTTSATTAFRVENANASGSMVVLDNGNVGIGTTTDAGFRLDVNGTARVQGITTITPATLTGSEATSALDISQTWNTTGAPTAIRLNVTDTASIPSSNLIELRVGGTTKFGVLKSGAIYLDGLFGSSGGAITPRTGGFSFSHKTTTGSTFGFLFEASTGTITSTSGDSGIISINQMFNPTSGTARFTLLNISSNVVINQTGGANGITRGLFINPTLTAAADWRSIELTNNTGFGIFQSGTATNSFAGNIGIGTTTPTSRLQVKGSGTTSSTTALRVENANASSSMVVLDNGFVGINTGSAQFNLDVNGTTRFNGLSIIQGTTASDTAPLGTELLTTGTGDASWTGADFATGYTHVTGSTTTLTSTLAGIVNTYYQITYTVTGRTAGSFTIAFGGFTSGNLTATGAVGPRATTTDTLVITPTSDFNGTIVLSIKTISISSASVTFNNSSGTVTNQIRISNLNSNTFIGLNAGSRNTTGVRNTANGSSALQNNTTGAENTANGYFALQNNTTGGGNTANGYFALQSNTTGGSNTANGHLALRNNTTGGSNTANGFQALFSNTTGINNTANGFQALRNNTTGTSNTANGVNALQSNTTGIQNTANGVQALLNNTTGANNTANGYLALQNNTTGSFNTSNGVEALRNNTTGVNNTAIGVNALLSNTTGSQNTAIGVNALLNNTTGGSNTANGISAGRFIANGTTANTITNNSVFIGADTKALADNQTNQIVIGHNATGLGSNTAVLGNDSIVTTALKGNVGIGTTAPSARLQVKGSGTTSATTSFRVENSSGNARLTILDDGTSAFNTSHLYISSSGNVGVGTSTPTNKFTVIESISGGGNAPPGVYISLSRPSSGGSPSATYFTDERYTLSGTDSFSNSLGKQLFATINSTGTNTVFRNVMSRVHTISAGAANSIAHYSTHTELFGTGTVSSWFGMVIGGTVTGFPSLSAFQGTSTITNTYGLFLGNFTAGTQSNAPYAIYQAGTEKIYLQGNVGIGTTTPTAKLHVSGSARIDEVLTLTPLDPLPTGSPTGSFAVSASVPPIPYFYDGTTWNALY